MLHVHAMPAGGDLQGGRGKEARRYLRMREVLEDQIVDDCLVERLDVLAVFKLRELQATSPPVSS
jgi:hypothetical protein